MPRTTEAREASLRAEQYVPSIIRDYTIGAAGWRLTIAGTGERIWSTSEVAAFLDGLDAATRIASVP